MDDFCVEFLSYLVALRLYLRGSANISGVEENAKMCLLGGKRRD